MRLILEMKSGPQKGTRREIGPEAEFCVGTLPDASWRLPMAVDDQLCDGAIWLRADSEGFFFVAEGKVSVEGHPVTPGSPVPLGHSAELEVAGHVLKVEVAHRAERLSPLLQAREASGPTITSILSDVAPGGGSATGALPGRAGESWMAGGIGALVGERPPSITKSAGASPALPADWNAVGDRTNRLVQTKANETTVRVLQQTTPDAASKAGESALLEAFRAGAGLPAEAQIDDPEATLALAGELLRVVVSGLARCEAAGEALLVEHALATPSTDLSVQPEHDLSAMMTGPGAISRLEARFAAVARHQRIVAAALERFIGSARDALDPQAVETRCDAGGRRGLLQSREAARWASYRRAWQGEETARDGEDGVRVGTGIEPLSTGAFAAALRAVEAAASRDVRETGERGL
ncbi:MAG: type VI secretion system-associated FHA domain protein [Pseudomonadota bacterium]